MVGKGHLDIGFRTLDIVDYKVALCYKDTGCLCYKDIVAPCCMGTEWLCCTDRLCHMAAVYYIVVRYMGLFDSRTKGMFDYCAGIAVLCCMDIAVL
jgi:hypothetical protein